MNDSKVVTAAEAAERWNKRHPIGTPILYWPGVMEGLGRESTVRSEAWVMPSGIAVAKVEGYAGGIALTHIGFRSEADFLAAENSAQRGVEWTVQS